jgi:hypothetical protein
VKCNIIYLSWGGGKTLAIAARTPEPLPEEGKMELFFTARAAARAEAIALRQWRKAVDAARAARAQRGPDQQYFWAAEEATARKASWAAEVTEQAAQIFWAAEAEAEDAHARVFGPAEEAAARADAAARMARPDLPAKRAKIGRGRGRKPRG